MLEQVETHDHRWDMDIRVGDVLTVKKQHPCGSRTFTVLRVGMDFKIRCTGCGREIMLPRSRVEKNIRLVNGARMGKQDV